MGSGNNIYEHILAGAQALLAENGPYPITVEDILARTGVSEANYKAHFQTAYDPLLVLFERLAQEQDAVGLAQLVMIRDGQSGEVAKRMEQIFVDHIRVTRAFTGGYALWAMLHAYPQLRAARIAALGSSTRLFVEMMRPAFPHMSDAQLNVQMRFALEIFCMTNEMLFETGFANLREVIKTASKTIENLFLNQNLEH